MRDGDVMNDTLLKTADVAELLNVSRDSVLKLIDDGKLRATKLGPKTFRIFKSSVDTLIAEGATL
jgi:excisionase family DNA binding protein